MNKELKTGFKVSYDGIIVSLTNNHVKLKLDRVINAVDGCVTGVMMKSLPAEHTNDGLAHTLIGNERIYNINHLHRLFEHCDQETLKYTIKVYSFKSLKLVRNVQLPRHNRIM